MDSNYKHIVLQFDQAQQPKYVEKKGKNYVEYGEDNDYPNYLLSLYNESAKHGAIIKGKVNYIFGSGFEEDNVCNSKGETWNDVMKRCIKDDELYRGYYLQIIWNRAKQVGEIYHLEFHKVRVSKDLQKFYVKNDWKDNREKAREYDMFNVNNPYGSQILYVKEYNPSCETYPLPSYFQGLNYIECDIQVSRHLLGLANQSFTGTTLINLNNGDPINEEHKGEVERGLLKKFTGDSGKRVVIMFNKSKENSAEILPLGTTTLTKEDFTNVNNLIQTEIFTCHQITSPTLFGITTSGALGQRNEMRDAYEIFSNTYVAERQQEFEKVFTKLRNLKGEQGEFAITPVEPIKFEFSETIISQNLTQDEIRELMGKEPIDTNVKTQAQIISDNINSLSPLVANKVLESMTPDEIRGLAGLVPTQPEQNIPSTPNVSQQVPMQSNDAIKNLTGRQYQNVMRIVRQFTNGKLNKQQASLMLKNGFNFTDDDVNTFLGIDDSPLTEFEIQKFSLTEEEQVAEMFSEYGEDFEEYEIVSRQSYKQSFATPLMVHQVEANVVDIMTRDSKINAEGIAKLLDLDVKAVEEVIKTLTEKKIIEIKTKKVGQDTITENKVLKPLSELGGKNSNITEFFVRYTYEWRDIVTDRNIDNSRPFCKRMFNMSAGKGKTGGKTWSMADIQSISLRLGYSVLDRCGGWWTHNGKHDYQCRHEWVANVVTKKKK